MSGEGLLALLQLADGLFPAGGFAHSFGLETRVQAGAVTDRDGVEDLVRAHLQGSAGPTDAVAVALAVRAAAAADLAACLDLDGRLDAMRAVPEFRAAAVQMGRATLRAARAFTGDPFVGRLADTVDDGLTPGHHPVAFGAVAGRAGAGAGDAALAYLHSTAALLVGAALRLLPLGQGQGQQVLARVRPLVARLAREATGARPDEMWSFTPALEIAGMRHPGLEARLFRS
jgi:urease accessory protein